MFHLAEVLRKFVQTPVAGLQQVRLTQYKVLKLDALWNFDQTIISVPDRRKG